MGNCRKILMFVGAVTSCALTVDDAVASILPSFDIKRLTGEKEKKLQVISLLDASCNASLVPGVCNSKLALGIDYAAFRDSYMALVAVPVYQKIMAGGTKYLIDTDEIIPAAIFPVGTTIFGTIIAHIESAANSASVDDESVTAGVTLDSTYGDFIAALNGAGGLLNGVAAGAGQLNAFNNYILDRWDGIAPIIHPATAAAFALRGAADRGYAGANNLKWHFLRAMISVMEEGNLGLGLGMGVGVGLTWRSVRALNRVLVSIA